MCCYIYTYAEFPSASAQDKLMAIIVWQFTNCKICSKLTKCKEIHSIMHAVSLNMGKMHTRQ